MMGICLSIRLDFFVENDCNFVATYRAADLSQLLRLECEINYFWLLYYVGNCVDVWYSFSWYFSAFICLATLLYRRDHNGGELQPTVRAVAASTSRLESFPTVRALISFVRSIKLEMLAAKCFQLDILTARASGISWRLLYSPLVEIDSVPDTDCKHKSFKGQFIRQLGVHSCGIHAMQTLSCRIKKINLP